MKFRSLLLLSALLFVSVCQAQLVVKKPVKTHPTSFAIFVDKTTYEKCAAAIDAYKDAVEEDGLSTYIYANDWKNPDEIKAEIIKLTKISNPIEGIVLIGDIPIPMIRNGQHMTSAFKIDEVKYKPFKSSAPSDRYYDDLDLKFEFIQQDSLHKLCFYYSVTPGSPQKVEKTIYSGRIKPSLDDSTKFDVITNYLNRVVKQKKEQTKIENMFVFTGHGYNSEALAAWGDEELALREQFPSLYAPGHKLKKLDHTMSNQMKDILLTELQNPALNVAIFHAHGEDNTQYINNYPEYRSVDGNVEQIKLFLRSKMRSAKRQKRSVDETKAYFMKEYNVPESWFNGSFSDSLVAADSLLDYSLDIHPADIAKIATQPELVVFDECFNGSFHHSPYIAGEYAFGKGKTVAGIANTTNALQDQWIDEFAGVLNYGVRFGQWHKFNHLLESHLIGDPTFHFANYSKTDLSGDITFKSKDVDFWRKALSSEDVNLRSLAVYFLFKNEGAGFEKDLVKIYHSDASYNVRMEALKSLATLQTPAFHEILKESISDPYEYIRRISAVWMGLVGKEEYISILVKQLFTDESERVSFNIRSALNFINPEESYNESVKYINSMPASVSKDKLKGSVKNQILRTKSTLKELLDNVNSDTLSLKNKLQEMRTFRNYTYLQAIPDLIRIAKNKNEKAEYRTVTIEALGWFNLAYNKDIIVKACEEIIKDSSSPKSVLKEAERTLNRIKEGPSNVVTP